MSSASRVSWQFLSRLWAAADMPSATAAGGQSVEQPRGGAQPNRIVFVNRYFFPDESATSRMLSDLAFRLALLGVPVSVVTSRQLYGNPRAALPRRELIYGVQVYRVAAATRGRAGLAGRTLDYATFHIAAAWALLRLLSAGDVVVAKTDPPLIAVSAARVARFKGARLVNWLQDLFPEVASILTPNLVPGWLEARLLAVRDRTLRRASMNVVLGEAMRARLLARGIDSAHVRIVPNWADTANMPVRSPGDSSTRHELGLTDRFVIGYSGNLGRAHEFETLLGAASQLRAEPRFRFLIIGAGARAESVRRAVHERGLQSFIFRAHQPAALLSDSLAASDVHLVSLLPALEGLIVPSKIYGILAAGRPAVFIGDTRGDVARLIRDHDCGVVVGVGDSEGLASQLRTLAADPRRVELMGRNARQLALARFSSEHAVAEWLGLIQLVAPGVTSAAPTASDPQPRPVL
jgi:glycosyltransferase involved in cell wall biosynthesis